MRISPLHQEIENYLAERGLKKKFIKQKELFENNPFHPGLGTELLEPRRMRFWSFRVDRKYRAIFIIGREGEMGKFIFPFQPSNNYL